MVQVVGGAGLAWGSSDAEVSVSRLSRCFADGVADYPRT
jgi:hypothetical protein